MKFIPFFMSRSEEDRCTFSLITAIITRWWYNKLSNNYSFSPYSSSHIVSEEVFHCTNICLPFILAHKENYKHIIHYFCMPAWKLNKAITREPSYFLLSTRCWDGDTLYSANLQDCWLNLCLWLTYTEKYNAWVHPPLRYCRTSVTVPS